jgi:hypothetical protein
LHCETPVNAQGAYDKFRKNGLALTWDSTSFRPETALISLRERARDKEFTKLQKVDKKIWGKKKEAALVQPPLLPGVCSMSWRKYNITGFRVYRGDGVFANQLPRDPAGAQNPLESPRLPRVILPFALFRPRRKSF